jgi:hypothetical protein
VSRCAPFADGRRRVVQPLRIVTEKIRVRGLEKRDKVISAYNIYADAIGQLMSWSSCSDRSGLSKPIAEFDRALQSFASFWMINCRVLFEILMLIFIAAIESSQDSFACLPSHRDR